MGSPRALSVLCSAVLVCVLQSCSSDSTSLDPQTGSILGAVILEALGVEGVTVTISGTVERSMTTGTDGSFRFDGVTVGSYTVRIEGGPADALFDVTSRTVQVIASQTVSADFEGVFQRTSILVVRVVALGTQLEGVRVDIEAPDVLSATTDANGSARFEMLRAVQYTVRVSGADPGLFEFSEPSQTIVLLPDQFNFLDFQGTEASTSSVIVTVLGGGAPLAGVTVSVFAGSLESGLTGADGVAVIGGLTRGTWSLEISDFGTDVIFDETTANFTISEIGGTASVTFEGSLFQATWAQVSAGWVHSCGLASDGLAYCWGRNDSGELGDGSTDASDRPVAVAGGRTYRDIAAGDGSSCAVAVDGAAWCWGANGSGQFGNGTTDASLVPVPVSGALSFEEVGIGGRSGIGIFVCGLTAAGAAHCWGTNGAGQLGDGTVVSSSVPVTVAGGHVFSTLGAGVGHTCGRTTLGQTWCWGAQERGQLGDPAVTNFSTALVMVTGGHTWASADADGFFTCGVTDVGDGYCWGRNDRSQLGDGTNAAERRSPTLVVGGLTFERIALGSATACGT